MSRACTHADIGEIAMQGTAEILGLGTPQVDVEVDEQHAVIG